MKRTLFLLLLSIAVNGQVSTKEKYYTALAKKVTITRDQWGIAHIIGKKDADAVFGMIYAQCEDDFDRIELNYIQKLGRLSEIKGEKYVYDDLQIRLLINEKDAKKEYFNAEPWLKLLLNAFADGINYYILKNKNCQPKLLKHFEPWYPLLWTDGSIGAINTADLTVADLAMFYGKKSLTNNVKPFTDQPQTGSNGFAVAPKLSASGNAMLYINPHTTFYFRPEIHVKSYERLNAYGAVTWGQIFVYQGFNENCGWMHTSSNADVADTYFEKINKVKNTYYYELDQKTMPVGIRYIPIKYSENNRKIEKVFKTYYTTNGPIMAEKDGKWISLTSNNRSIKSFKQSWLRTKADGLETYKKIMDLRANTSNNTVFADKKGNIAYWHGNYMPKRNKKLNWSLTQDGSNSNNKYAGLHTVNETVHVYNPLNGWIQNCNSTPFTVSDTNSPIKEKYPNYMAPDGENFRGINASRLLKQVSKIDLNDLIAIGYDKKLSAFEILIPGFINKKIVTEDQELIEAIDTLKNWDYIASKKSVATTLAIEWALKLDPILLKVYADEGEKDQVTNTKEYINNAQVEDLLKTLKGVITTLKQNHSTWKIPWGQINRFQRLNNKIDSEFNDSEPSLEVSYASAVWGCLPSFNSKMYPNTYKKYGFNGNSFVCAVEFGEKIKAKSLLAGGNNGNPNSKNFKDQAQMYVDGVFKDVLFYEEDIHKNAVKIYHPGE